MLNLTRFSNSVGLRARGPVAWPAAQPVQAPMPTAPAEIQVQATQQKTAGNEFRRLRMYPQAIQSYETAIRINPRYTDAYYNLANLHVLLGQTPRAVQLLTQLLYLDPNDHDARVTLGEYWEKMGNTQEAKRRYLEVLGVRPDFDPANRRLQYLLYLDQKRFYPDTASALMQARQREVTHKARELMKQYYTLHHPNTVLLQLSQTIPIQFAETQKIDETANIAEYDAPNRLVRVHPMMMFSTPNVVAAYLAHELVHAIDEEPLTSITEEQDGYRELARFWSIYQGAENEPNLDRAMDLYLRNADALDQEVRRVYSIRDARIPEKSPGHGMPPQNRLSIAYQAAELQQKPLKLEQLRQMAALHNMKLVAQ